MRNTLILITFVVFVFNSLGIGLGAQDALTNNYQEFKAFLSEKRPPFLRVIYTRSKDYYFLQGKMLGKDVRYEASVQSNTSYVKEFGSPFLKDPSAYTVSGISQVDEWYIDQNGQVSVLNRDRAISGTNTPPESYVANLAFMLDETLCLGIYSLDRSSIVWSNNEFTARTLRPENFGVVSGRIEGTNSIAPNSLTYKFSKKPDITYNVRCEYTRDTRRPAWMPNAILISLNSPRFSQKQNAHVKTNFIDSFEYGVSNLPPNGYVYTQFIRPGAILTNAGLFVYTNGVGYVLMGDKFEAVRRSDVPPPPSKTKIRSIKGLIVAERCAAPESVKFPLQSAAHVRGRDF
jgi:hypothetical protein